ncbi:hypothetical protein RHECIAT_CH0000325 [Rhizobium etli CIAT 652]|uniref:Uncharacterized protein n=1 Tax=Rhizobium etli (strain CIAT 652) TaxID=491916 RepID=B3PYG8_RHIE6|nr:hypothetical protein RHECIAT_CH0000325 [Rhizobium etli CIAT 652]
MFSGARLSRGNRAERYLRPSVEICPQRSARPRPDDAPVMNQMGVVRDMIVILSGRIRPY